VKSVDVLGVKATPDKVEGLVHDQLESGSTWRSRDDMDNAAGLGRAIDALTGSPLQPDFITAALKYVRDPNPIVRMGALLTMRSYGRQIDAAPKLLTAWHDRPELYRGVRIPLPEGDLEALLLSAMAAAAQSSNITVLEALHQLVRDPSKRDLVFAGLARAEPEWMADHVSDWMDGNANRLAAILHNLPNEAKVEKVVHAMAAAPPEVRASAAEVIRRFVPDRDRAAHLISLLDT